MESLVTLSFAPSDDVRRIRESIDHPVIDSDGHIVEYLPDLRERIRTFGGADVVRRFDRHYWSMDHITRLPPAVQRRFGISRPPWWTYQARNSLDRATATFPNLLYERLPELGLDFAVIYPSYFVQFPAAGDEDFRRAGCRAVNQYLADTFRHLADRMTPVAAIPMHTPDEAVEELRFATEELGLRAAVLNGVVLRPVPGSDRVWVDTLGLDSAHDYTPVWRFCEDNGIAATFHSVGMNWGSRASVSNFMHNHVGHFAAAGEGTARSLLFAGVPTRFPRLRFAFLEGGAAWAGALYAQLTGNFSKRNREAVRHYDPRTLDVALIRDLLGRYGTPTMTAAADDLDRALLPLSTPVESIPDEFAGTGLRTEQDIRDVFERSLFFGCEGDDPMSAVATDRFARYLGIRVNAIYGSDIGHWDVPDIREVLPEVYELVDRGVFEPADFRCLVFDAPVRLWTDNNPGFFDGTAVEAAVRGHRARLDAAAPDADADLKEVAR
jgi:predicted TIM-barrel fold metal-dependent hydrolase